MSWHETFTEVNGVTVEDLEPQDELTTSTEEMREQFNQAKYAAHDVIATGVVGPVEGTYRITVSGHANPNHRPAERWANDHLTISISQVNVPEV